jgi:succinate dehydrogenase/fumarate reductase flavoprotein subunit
MRRIQVVLLITLCSVTGVALLVLAAARTGLAQNDEMRKHILHELAGPFIVFRANVQEELKLSDSQKQKMEETVPDTLGEAQKFMETLHRDKAGDKFNDSLKETLKPGQLARLKQLQLQHEGPAALGRPEIRKELNITQQQLMKFMGVVQDMQKKIEPLIKEAQSGGDPEVIRPKVIKIRKEHEALMIDFLSDEQKKMWQEKVGKPVDVLTP